MGSVRGNWGEGRGGGFVGGVGWNVKRFAMGRGGGRRRVLETRLLGKKPYEACEWSGGELEVRGAAFGCEYWKRRNIFMIKWHIFNFLMVDECVMGVELIFESCIYP